jgi:hypothetical protein
MLESETLSFAFITSFFDGFFSSRAKGYFAAGTSIGKGFMGCSSFFICKRFRVLGEYFSLFVNFLISGIW